jgi:hypothetical protein
VKGLRSTGLEADVYDVVITAGGFAKACHHNYSIVPVLPHVKERSFRKTEKFIKCNWNIPVPVPNE